MEALLNGGVVAARDHPSKRSALYARAARNELRMPLPGIFTTGEDSWENRIQCAQAWAPDLVLCGTGAARLSWWPDAPIRQVHLCGGERQARPGWLKVSQAVVDPDWIMWLGDHKIASPPLSALQAALEIGPNALDEALRRGAVTLAQLHEAFRAMPRQTGKAELRRLLHESRDVPWSPLEREGHQELRRARIKGWKTNFRIMTRGEVFYLDIALPQLRVGVELDGYQFHSGRDAFERDRVKQNLLVLDGWRLLRFTSNSVRDMPGMLRELMGD